MSRLRSEFLIERQDELQALANEVKRVRDVWTQERRNNYDTGRRLRFPAFDTWIEGIEAEVRAMDFDIGEALRKERKS